MADRPNLGLIDRFVARVAMTFEQQPEQLHGATSPHTQGRDINEINGKGSHGTYPNIARGLDLSPPEGVELRAVLDSNLPVITQPNITQGQVGRSTYA